MQIFAFIFIYFLKNKMAGTSQTFHDQKQALVRQKPNKHVCCCWLTPGKENNQNNMNFIPKTVLCFWLLAPLLEIELL